LLSIESSPLASPPFAGVEAMAAMAAAALDVFTLTKNASALALSEKRRAADGRLRRMLGVLGRTLGAERGRAGVTTLPGDTCE
jgi:hypothetical protein